MTDKIAISRIEIKIGKDVLKLSLAQMLELKDVLNETFPDEKIGYIPGYPIPYPIFIQPPTYPWRGWLTTCGDSTTTTNTFHIEASPCQD